jgi:hypothetical protein
LDMVVMEEPADAVRPDYASSMTFSFVQSRPKNILPSAQDWNMLRISTSDGDPSSSQYSCKLAYATQTLYSESKKVVTDSIPNLRKMLIQGDVFLGSVVSSCLTKLCLRASDLPNDFTPVKAKEMSMQTLLVMKHCFLNMS